MGRPVLAVNWILRGRDRADTCAQLEARLSQVSFGEVQRVHVRPAKLRSILANPKRCCRSFTRQSHLFRDHAGDLGLANYWLAVNLASTRVGPLRRADTSTCTCERTFHIELLVCRGRRVSEKDFCVASNLTEKLSKNPSIPRIP